jgi:hypothetical protein
MRLLQTLLLNYQGNVCMQCFHWFFLGDFNLIRSAKDKNTPNVNQTLIDKFNMFIDLHQLKEIKRHGPKFTWTNKQSNPVMVNLDKVLVSPEWEIKFLLCFVWSRTRVGSDHWPIFMDSGGKSMREEKHFFENQWLLEEDFKVFVDNRKEIKNRFGTQRYSLDVWHWCMRQSRQFLKGWNANRNSEDNKLKREMLEKMDILGGERPDEVDWVERYGIEYSLEEIMNKEEMHWQQRVTEKWLLQGDANTSFFHMCANGRRRKTRICSLDTEDDVISKQEDIAKHIVKFYKKLFGSSEHLGVHLRQDFWPKGERLDEDDGDKLQTPFLERDVEMAISRMKSNSTPGPNGFSVTFLKNVWKHIKGDIMNMVQDFNNNALDLKRLNYGVITLVPKVQKANTIRQYRPICLLNVDFKIFPKLLTGRISPLADKIISESQTAFIKGRTILEGVVILHEVIHELKRSRSKGVMFKIDFENAYDKVRWDFVQEVMVRKGCPKIWVDQVMSTVQGGSIFVNVNGERRQFFRTFQGLRKGDPLSPYCSTWLQNF